MSKATVSPGEIRRMAMDRMQDMHPAGRIGPARPVYAKDNITGAPIFQGYEAEVIYDGQVVRRRDLQRS